MRSMILATMILCLLALGASAFAAGDAPMNLNFGDGSQWRCVGGEWSGGEEGLILPTQTRNTYSEAYYTGKAYSDVTVEFEYWAGYREAATGSAGLILRSNDGQDAYWVYFPWCGQPYRAKHFWAGLGKLNGDGYVRNITFDVVPNVIAEWERWYTVKVQAVGPRIKAWVDGRLALDVTDNTYKSGLIGLAGYGEYQFRNLRVTGTGTKAPKLPAKLSIPKNQVELPIPCTWPTGCVAPNGDVLIGSGQVLLRSTDKGRTWTKEALPEFVAGTEKLHVFPMGDGGSTLLTTAKGRLIAVGAIGGYITKGPSRAHGFWLSESFDSGKTWTEAEFGPLTDDSPWPNDIGKERVYLNGPMVETEDGALVRFTYGSIEDNSKYTNVNTWAAEKAKSLAFRSTDGGKTWSGPIELDRPLYGSAKYNSFAPRGTIPGSLDLTETTGVAIGNTVMALSRPIYSPWMWQMWSYDGGVTWDSAARTTFPGYAQAMIKTKSGAIVCAHRYPGYAVNVSWDNGLNWDQGTVIDWPTWAMGNIIEVEPDVLLLTYMNSDLGDVANLQKFPLLMQRVKLTKDGIKPVK